MKFPDFTVDAALRGVKTANILMGLAMAGGFALLGLSSLNCADITRPETSLDRDDSLAVAAIFKANKKSWPKTYFPERDGTGRIIGLPLSSMGLDTIPPEIGDLTKLISMHLDYNKIRSLPSEVENLTDLTRLDLRGNALEALPDGFQLAHLTDLDLGANRISSLPLNVDVTSLETLRLDSNLIESLPPDFRYLTALVSLDLRNNRLDSLPSDIGALPNLKRLMVAGNGLPSLPPGLMESDLDFLNVAHNRICLADPAQSDSAQTEMAEWLDGMDRDWRATQKCD